MQNGWRTPTWAVLSMMAAALSAHAEAPWPTAAPSMTFNQMAPLNDLELMTVRGAGLDATLLAELQKGRGQARQDDDARRKASDAVQATQTAAAMNTALALQTIMALRLSTSAVSTINTATQIGGTLIALTPVTAISPIGLPLFGLPSLPPKTSH